MRDSMSALRRIDLEEAADEGEGVCLNCGAVQEFLERRLLLGLCHECGEQEVVEGELAVRVLGLVDDGEGEGK